MNTLPDSGRAVNKSVVSPLVGKAPLAALQYPITMNAGKVRPMEVFDKFFGRCKSGSLIALGSRRPDSKGVTCPHYLTVLKADEWREHLPGIFEWRLDQTQYLMVNTLSQSALIRPASPIDYVNSLLNGKPLYYRAGCKNVSELCGIVIDLDVGRPEHENPCARISSGQALGAVLDLCQSGCIPWPSMAALSGRGAYLCWLLRHDEVDIAPPLATQDNITVWKLCTKRLLQYLEHLAADSNATRIANWYKRPGTIDTKTGNEVVYMSFGYGSIDNAPIYSLNQLMQALGIQHPMQIMRVESLPVRSAQPHKPFQPARFPTAGATASRNGAIRRRNVRAGKGGEPDKRRMEEIQWLNEYRGGISEGARHLTLWHFFRAARAYLATLYRDQGEDRFDNARKDAFDMTASLNARFTPPLSTAEVKKACDSKAGITTRNITVVTDLRITMHEALELDFKSLIPQSLFEERKADKARQDAAKASKQATQAKIKSDLLNGRRDLTAMSVEYDVSKQAICQRRRRLIEDGLLHDSQPLFAV